MREMVVDAGLGAAPLDIEVRCLDHRCIGSLREIGFGGAGW